ncbi:Hypothetical Protein FCC1311_014882 [Hondaea fermentalgiana]|uniref:Uncharacterized protein n=1 Tax=Hondaea fermentalgiana TaxID=2315210 RepID=A0A2R5GAZ5_9STRA|nr:Hypothetical Protein FCC1311_014882 [Hondaea fermentalgiana]|eukprot:GBG25271.1 Hypothetical Protein FCC1311_014882 [Hondaea fermentalgiana]
MLMAFLRKPHLPLAVALLALQGDHVLGEACPDQGSVEAAQEYCTSGIFSSSTSGGYGTYTCGSCSGTGQICSGCGESSGGSGSGGTTSLESCPDLSASQLNSYCTSGLNSYVINGFGTYSCSSCSGQGEIEVISCGALESVCSSNGYGSLASADVDTDGGTYSCTSCSTAAVTIDSDDGALDEGLPNGLREEDQLLIVGLYIGFALVAYAVSVALASRSGVSLCACTSGSVSVASRLAKHPLLILLCFQGPWESIQEWINLALSFALAITLESAQLFEMYTESSGYCYKQVSTVHTVKDDIIVLFIALACVLVVMPLAVTRSYGGLREEFPEITPATIIKEYGEVFALSTAINWIFFEPIKVCVFTMFPFLSCEPEPSDDRLDDKNGTAVIGSAKVDDV